jgi:magnesium transporter
VTIIQHKHQESNIPGQFIVAEHEKHDTFNPIIYVMLYNEHEYTSCVRCSIEYALDESIIDANFDNIPVRWIHIQYHKNDNVLNKIKDKFNVHSLTMEDITRGGQRSKHECYKDYDAIFLQTLTKGNTLKQLSMIFNADTLITFCDDEDLFETIKPIFKRISDNLGRIRKKGADYLAYSLCDIVTDRYFKILEDMEAKIETLDDDILADANPKVLQDLHMLKKDMLLVKKTVWPLRELATSMQRGESLFISEGTYLFIRDLYDHTIRISENAEALRDSSYSLVDLYMSINGMKMNETMKVLTIISTIFVPVTFITSIYGMNFDGIIETHWKYGYVAVWFVMASIAACFMWWFKKKNWL